MSWRQNAGKSWCESPEQFGVPSHGARSAAETLHVAFKHQTVQSFTIQKDYCDVVCQSQNVMNKTQRKRFVNPAPGLCRRQQGWDDKLQVSFSDWLRGWLKEWVCSARNASSGFSLDSCYLVTSQCRSVHCAKSLLHTEAPLIYPCMQGIFAFFAICSINCTALPTSHERVSILITVQP